MQKEYAEKINKEQEVLLTYNKAYSFFGNGEFKKALSYINIVLNDSEQNLRQDIYSFSRLFNVVLHFELENYDFLDYLIKSTNRYLNKQERSFEIENVCIRNIRKIAKLSDNSEILKTWLELKVELNELLNNRNEKVILEYFNINAWVESKIEKITLSEAVKRLL